MNDFETKLTQFIQREGQVPDADTFVKNLHTERGHRKELRQRFYTGIAAGILILMLGMFTASQLGGDPAELMVYDAFEIVDEEDRIEAEFITEMAVYLVEQNDDIWETLAFFEEIEFELIDLTMKEKTL